jgi:MotA/TolQ/ExbB proton channel family
MTWYGTVDGTAAKAEAIDQQAPVWRPLGDWWRALGQDDPVTYRYVLLLRFTLANAIAVALVGAAIGQGWVSALLAADYSIYTQIIIAIFIVGLIWSGQRALQISRGLNEIKGYLAMPKGPSPDYLARIEGRDSQSRTILASCLRLKLASRIAPIRHIANSLVLLGLVGTVIGFIIALSGVQPDTVSEVSAIGPMVSTLIAGMAVALHTTLAGSLLHLWLMINVRLLEGGTIKLLTATVELGERHVRP